MINILPGEQRWQQLDRLRTYCRFPERVKRSNERLARGVLAHLYRDLVPYSVLRT
jgi:hypothetical protein